MDPLNPSGKATSTQYAPGTPANWSPPPTQVAAALDQLAAKTELPDDAATTNYEPGTPGNWAGAAPTSVSTALDRIAALVRTLNGGPIP